MSLGEGAHGCGLDLWLFRLRLGESRASHTVRPRPRRRRPPGVSIGTRLQGAICRRAAIPGYRSGPSLRRMLRHAAGRYRSHDHGRASPGRVRPRRHARSSSTRRSPWSWRRSRSWPSSARSPYVGAAQRGHPVVPAAPREPAARSCAAATRCVVLLVVLTRDDRPHRHPPGGQRRPAGLGILVAIYTVGERLDRPTSLGLTALTAAILAVVVHRPGVVPALSRASSRRS